MTYRVLSLDGGAADQTGAFLSLVERRAEGLSQSLIGSADLFTGTSTGGVAALLFAFYDDPVVALEALLRFHDEVCKQGIAGSSPLGLAGLLTGFTPAHDQSGIRAFCASVFGERTPLSALRKNVLIWTFQLDGDPTLPVRQWHPRAFGNFAGDLSGNELIMDVVLRTMGMPIEYPVHQSVAGTGPSFVDGAVATNNPAALTVAHALGHHTLEELQVLSIGRPRNLAGKANFLEIAANPDGSANWGYRQWLLDVGKPLLLIDMFLQAGAEVATYQCRKLLGSRFHRIEPSIPSTEAWDSPDMSEIVDVVMDWLDSGGWFVPQGATVAAPGIIDPTAPDRGDVTVVVSTPDTPPSGAPSGLLRP